MNNLFSFSELDDGAYNPLWATKGFTQTFHFWKEHRRQQSIPLNAFLTYVTLPWWSIAKGELKKYSITSRIICKIIFVLKHQIYWIIEKRPF